MILSIGMIVKNEEKYLHRCLSALKPVLDALDSELIIADTGSTDNTVEIAKEFTDNVFYFEWCNDYSKARNATVEKAKGEWYMFIDADEILKDPQPLIDFFSSGEYKSYDNAIIVQRNVSAEEKTTSYEDFHANRLIKKDENTKFSGYIHEALPVGTNIKHIDVILNHYGYITGRKFTKKCRRYLKSILKELHEEPDSWRTYIQLIDAQYNVNRYKATEFANEAVSKFAQIFYWDILYERFISCLHTSKDFFYAEEIIKQSLKLEIHSIVDINIYTYLINLYYATGKYDKLINAYEKLMNIRKEYLNKPLTSLHTSFMQIKNSDMQHMYNIILLITAYIRTERYEDAYNALQECYEYPEAMKEMVFHITSCLFELYRKTGNDEYVKDFISHVYPTECISDVNAAVNIKLAGQVIYFKDSEYMYDIFKMLNEYSDSMELYKFYGLIYKEKSMAPLSELKQYISDMNSSLSSVPEMLYFILKYNCPLSDNAVKHLKTQTVYVKHAYFYDFADVIYNAVISMENTDLILPLCEQIFIFWNDLSLEKRRNIKAIYYNAVSDNIKNIINDNISVSFQGNICNILPPVIRFRYLYKQLTEAKANKDYEAEKNIKDMIENIDLPINIFRESDIQEEV